MADNSEEESPYLTMSAADSPSDMVKPAMPPSSKTDERMDVDVTSLSTKETTSTTSTIPMLQRHGMSRSAPSSPSRPRIFRATSANSNDDPGNDKRGEQDLETASILVDMSQTKLAHKGGDASTPQGKRPLPNNHLPPGHPSQKQAVFCVPQGYSIVGRVGGPLQSQPVRFFNPPSQHPHHSHHFQDGSKRSKALPPAPPHKQPPIAPQPKKDYPPLSPPPPPPDSPDSSRREYSDPPKREIPRDDKTRLYLQEKINKERDRFRGKRSISFHEEFDEYKTTTRKAAKRALLSANPFNLGVKVPDNFLMRPEKRLHPQAKSISAGVMKFFASSLDEKAIKGNENQMMNGKSPNKNASQYESPYRSMADIEIQRNQRNYPPGQPPLGTVPLLPNSQHNPALDPYKTSEDLRKYRESALMKPNEELNRKPEMQTIVQGIQDMHAHSPKDLSYEDNRLPSNRLPERRIYVTDQSIRPDLSATSTMTTTTINGFLQQHPHGISSIFMPVQQVRFPYGNPADPSQSPYQLPPTSTLVTRPVGNLKNIVSGAAIYPPPGNYQILPAMHIQTHGDRARPIIMNTALSHVRPRIQPAQPTIHPGKYPTGPPNLPRFDRVTPGIYTPDHPRLPAPDSHVPYTALQNIRSSESSQSAYQTKVDPTNVPKLDNVISYGNKPATTIQASPTIVKKEPVDSDYPPNNANKIEKQRSDYSSNMNRTEKQGPLSPAGLFSPTEPTLFQPNVHKSVLKKQIARVDLKFDRRKDILGKGQFGVVYKAKWMFTDPSTKQKKEVDVAVKTLHEDNPLTDEAMDDLIKEADAMAILTSESLTENEGSKHILKMYGVCDDHKNPKKFSIITERAQGGALDTYLYKNKASLGDNGLGYCLFYARQIAIGMEYLHSLNLIHRDLACRNILVMDRELVKISDFGLSRIFTDSEYYRTTKDKKLPFHWMAIETIGNLRYTKETDYWSYGVLLWEALTVIDKDFQRPKVQPYKEIPNDELHSYLDKGNRLVKPKGCPDKLYNDIMLKCWERDPQQRPTFYRSNKALKDLMDEIEFCVGQ